MFWEKLGVLSLTSSTIMVTSMVEESEGVPLSVATTVSV